MNIQNEVTSRPRCIFDPEEEVLGWPGWANRVAVRITKKLFKPFIHGHNNISLANLVERRTRFFGPVDQYSTVVWDGAGFDGTQHSVLMDIVDKVYLEKITNVLNEILTPDR